MNRATETQWRNDVAANAAFRAECARKLAPRTSAKQKAQRGASRSHSLVFLAVALLDVAAFIFLAVQVHP